MYRCTDLPSTVQTFLMPTGLNKTTRGTDGANYWEPDVINVTKYTFTPIVNFKGSLTNRAPGKPRARFYISVHAEWAD